MFGRRQRTGLSAALIVAGIIGSLTYADAGHAAMLAGSVTTSTNFAAGLASSPVVRRSLIALIALLCAFALCLRGWDHFDRSQRWQGFALFLIGAILGVGAMTLLRLSDYPQTWGWLL